MKQADGQTYCSLPWCGASFGAPYHSRVFVVDGAKVRLTYPSMIEYHDIVPRSQGGDPEDLTNQAPICHECHTAHHSSIGVGRLIFCGSAASRADGRTGLLVIGDRTDLDAL